MRSAFPYGPIGPSRRRQVRERSRSRLDGPDDVAVAHDDNMAVWIGHLEAPMWWTVHDDAYGKPFGLPLRVGRVEVLHHEVPADGPGRDVLGVVSDREVRSASHLKHGEVVSHLDRTHPDLLIEAGRDSGVAATKGDVPGPNRWSASG